MKTLINIQETNLNNEAVKTVNARELHKFLESKQEFAHWIRDRIEQYDFSEGQDFLINLSKTPSGGRPSKEYYISLEMAKELSMVERSKKGKEARQYFIACEKKAKEAKFLIPQTLPEALRLAADLADQNKQLEHKIQEATPKVEAFERISDANGSLCLRDAAKTLQVQPSKLNQLLQEKKWIYRRLGCKNLIGYQDKLQQGVLTHKVTTYIDSNTGEEKITEQVRVTPKGLAKLAEILLSETV